MNATDITRLFGAAMGDASLDALFAQLDTDRRPHLPVDDYRYHDWVMVPAKGVELGFSDSQHQAGGPFYLWGSGDLLLTQVYFYADFEGIDPYQGELPYGLRLEDDRDTAREKLSAFEATRHSGLNDTWDVEGYRLNLTYDDDEQGIARVACLALPAPAQRLGDVTPPALASLVEAFGAPLKPAALKPLWPAGWDDESLGMALDDGELDLTDSYGVTLLYQGKNGKLLHTVVLHANGDQASAGWEGELPCGLSFDDSPDTLLDKMQDDPVYHADGELAGLAVWEQPGFTLHVRYSNLHNRLQRVSLIAPGKWRRPSDEDLEALLAD